MVDQLTCSLKPSVAYFAYLLRVKSPPLLPIELLIKEVDEFRVDEVDESIANIAVILN